MRRLRILVYVARLRDDFLLAEVAEQSRRHDVRLLCLAQHARVPDHVSFRVLGEACAALPRVKRWLCQHALWCDFRAPAFRREIAVELDAFQPDLVHTHYGDDTLAFLSNYEDRGTPLAVTFRGYDVTAGLRNRVYLRRYRALLAKPHVFPIAVCRALVRGLCAAGVDAQRALILYSGTDTEYFRRSNPSPSGRRIVLVGSLRHKKGHQFMIPAFARYLQTTRDAEATLHFAGEGSLEAELRTQCRTLGIADRVFFEGPCDREKVRTLFEGARVAVQPSVTSFDGDQEGIPNSLMEAMAMELPVIATRHSGIPELVEDGVHGILVDEGDIQGLAVALERIWAFGRNSAGRARIIESFEHRKHNDTLEGFYRRMADGSHPPMRRAD
jgi:colanic acid/amylovoran biosynthesis glycosyltransferase